MLRNFGISLLLLGLMGAAYDGFRVRERSRVATPSNLGADLTTSEASTMPPR